MNFFTSAFIVLALSLPGRCGDDGQIDKRTVSMRVSKYGITVRVPREWRAFDKFQSPFVLSAWIPQPQGLGDGLFTCRVSPALQTLESIQEESEVGFRESLEQGRAPGQTLHAEIVHGPWRECLMIRHVIPPLPSMKEPTVESVVVLVEQNHIYEFTLWAAESMWPDAQATFEAVIDSAVFEAPIYKCILVDTNHNRWRHEDDGLSIDLPMEWNVVHTDKELLAAVGPAGNASYYPRLTIQLDDHVEPEKVVRNPQSQFATSPKSLIRSCTIIGDEDEKVLEAIIDRPFGRTEMMRRIPGAHFDYLVSFECETEEFAGLEAVFRLSLGSFKPGAGLRKMIRNEGKLTRLLLPKIGAGLDFVPHFHRVLTPSIVLASWASARLVDVYIHEIAIAF